MLKKISKQWILVISLILTLFSQLALSEEKSAENRLFDLLSKLDSMQADFQQQVINEQGELLQETSGGMTIKRPGKLLWITRIPYQHQVITDGETLWVYDLDLEQVTQQAFVRSLDQAPALLLSGDLTAISEQFVITNHQDKQNEFRLTPKNEGSVFAHIELHFEENQLDRLILNDNFGQRTDIAFNHVLVNLPVQDKQFIFTPPEHVDLIINEH